MILTIETATNGYIIRTPPESEDYAEYVEVVENDNPINATHDMLWSVLEAIGHRGSRYDERRIGITISPGDKWISTVEAKQWDTEGRTP